MSGAARMIRNIMTLGIWTLVSRGAGLARDLMMANYLGAGAVADAFNVAFSLPNMFRRFFAEGARSDAMEHEARRQPDPELEGALLRTGNLVDALGGDVDIRDGGLGRRP